MPNAFESFVNRSKPLMVLTLPILGTQLAQTGMGVVDTLIAGQAGTLDLAAVAVGASIWVPLLMFVSGVMAALSPMVAHAKGARDKAASAEALHQGLWLSGLVGIGGALILWLITTPLMNVMGVESSIAMLTQEYLNYIAMGLPAVAIYQSLRSYNEAVGLTKPVTVMAFAGLGLNIILNYIFVLGWGPIEAMGGPGCGLASAIVFWVSTIAIWLYTLHSKHHQKIQPLKGFQAPHLATIGKIASIGVPIGLAIFVEVSIFSAIALLIARLGPEIVAAHQIALNVSSLVFMIPLSLALALTVRVGQELGAGSPMDAKLAWKNGLMVNVMMSLVTAGLVLALRQPIVELYSSDAPVVELASYLLWFAALYQISDAIQVGAAGALRGYKDTFVMLLLTIISFWIVGLPLGYWLGLGQTQPLGAAGFWIGLVAGLSVNAILLLARLKFISKRTLKRA